LHYWKRTPKDKFLQETAIDLPEGGLTPLHAIMRCSLVLHRGATLREEFLQETAIPLMEGILTPLLAITLFFHGITLRDEFLQETAIAPLVVSPNPLLAIMQFLIVILKETAIALPEGGLTLLHAIMRCSLGHHRRVTLRDTLGHQCGTASRRVACDALSNVNVL